MLPDEFDETADCLGSYYAAVAELRRRYLSGEAMPEGWDPRATAQACEPIAQRRTPMHKIIPGV